MKITKKKAPMEQTPQAIPEKASGSQSKTKKHTQLRQDDNTTILETEAIGSQDAYELICDEDYHLPNNESEEPQHQAKVQT
jgi:hypothetical protein